MIEQAMLKAKAVCEEFLSKEHKAADLEADLAPVLKAATLAITAVNFQMGAMKNALALELWKGHKDLVSGGGKHVMRVYLAPDGKLLMELYLASHDEKLKVGVMPRAATLADLLRFGVDGKDIAKNVLKYVTDPDNLMPPFQTHSQS